MVIVVTEPNKAASEIRSISWRVMTDSCFFKQSVTLCCRGFGEINQPVNLMNYFAQVCDRRVQDFTGNGDDITRQNNGHPCAFQAANRLKVHPNCDQLVEQRADLLGANRTSRPLAQSTFHMALSRRVRYARSVAKASKVDPSRGIKAQHRPGRSGCLCVGAHSEQDSVLCGTLFRNVGARGARSTSVSSVTNSYTKYRLCLMVFKGAVAQHVWELPTVLTENAMMNHSSRRSPLQSTGFPFVVRLGVTLFAFSGTAMSQTAAPVGTVTAAQYDCSGQEGPALTSCKQLNAAALRGAMVSQDPSRNPTHDCTGMSGASLATCRDLNGEPVSPAAVEPGGSSVPMAGVTNGAAATPPGTGQPTALPLPAPTGTVPATNMTPPQASPSMPGDGQVAPPPDRIEAVGPASTGVTQPAAPPAMGAVGGASQKSGK
jgi:hypothetical protein